MPQTPTTNDSSTRGLGIGLAISAYSIWAMYPFYWVLVVQIGFLEIFAHRMVWSLLCILLLVPIFDGLAPIKMVLQKPKMLGALTLSAAVIGMNWFLYIYSVSIDRIVEASLGYFMSPIFATFAAMIFLRERLHHLQYAAVGVVLVGIAIALLSYGQVPWLSIGMAVTFALYSTIRRHIRLPALTALAVELIPSAGVALAYLISINGGVMMEKDIPFWLLVMSAGPATVLPLMLYGLAVNRAPLVPVALLFYIVPTSLLIISVGVFGETFKPSDVIVFGCAWLGLGLYGLQALWDMRKRRQG